ncbi:MAG: YdeI/OmpD-associated family protein, partial [Thaumarchaeota archaeon]|nr:YdeI/OmpD-associated family protein [Nitrososphaerota archaeon]
RDKIGKGAGDRVKVAMDPDSAPVVVTAPKDFRSALASKPSARTTFEKMAPSHKKAYINWIDEAKGEVTRSRRIAKALAMIAEGKKL